MLPTKPLQRLGKPLVMFQIRATFQPNKMRFFNYNIVECRFLSCAIKLCWKLSLAQTCTIKNTDIITVPVFFEKLHFNESQSRSTMEKENETDMQKR